MSLSTEDFAFVGRLLHDKAGIVVSEGKEYLVEARLQALSQALGLSGIPELVRKVRDEGDSKITFEIIDAMTTNETSFFRDLSPFEVMKTSVIPEMISARQSARELRIWSGACSSGQEPYSILMLLHENFPELASWDIKLLATDISPQMLERARAGKYTQFEVNRGLAASMLTKYFEKSGKEWIVKPLLRDAVKFEQINLTHPFPPIGPFDVVFLRNVLIYFDVNTKARILSGLAKVIRPDGFLFLGAAETTLNLGDDFKRHSTGKTSYYRPIGAPVLQP